DAPQRVRTRKQWPRPTRLAVAQTVHHRFRPDVQVNHQVAVAELGTIFQVDERATAGADHLVLLSHDAANRFALKRPKAGLAIFAKDVRDAAARHLLDVAVGIDEREAQAAGDVAAPRGLAAGDAADQEPVI